MARDFGSRVKKAREGRRITQKDLATLTRVDIMQISRYERGRGMPAAETIVALASALKVTTDYLLVGKNADEDLKELPIGDVVLLEKFREAQEMTGKDREALLLVIDSILARREEEARVDRRRRSA